MCWALESGISVLEVREESMSFVMVLHAQRSQYCPIRCMKTMKSYKRYKHIFAPRIDSKGSYI